LEVNLVLEAAFEGVGLEDGFEGVGYKGGDGDSSI
jgi:hypothetical protein